eukprot:CAMPEP_0206528608 /NCGR_PEP_ID=MMETSP0325_2-20121206/2081_1 /ASSEMBLY_ACC=CAM_ASM_000347 /TAXON_ID=2866 /ORGANISM="Crypthecodinium cohnii, Strain Seligo" /LENGTH=39 /DNA_ID= /DNA_START= /DNA_END= /DNA_ORIENTATION=
MEEIQRTDGMICVFVQADYATYACVFLRSSALLSQNEDG